MRTLLIASFIAASHLNAFAQCSPDPQYTEPGIYPLSLPDAPADQPYQQTLTVVSGSTIPGIGLPLTSYEITSITGMPDGFTYQCVPSNCIFLPNTSGCVLISGSPTQGDIGFYPVVVNLLINGSLTFQLTDYSINVTGEQEPCFVGYLQSEFFQAICPGAPGLVNMSDVEFPTGGQYGLSFTMGADGGGGPEGDFNLTGVTLPYSLDADLNGTLSFNSLPPLTGTWEIAFFIYTDANDLANTVCSFSYNDTGEYIEAQFLDGSSPECLSTGTNLATQEPTFSAHPNPTDGPLTLQFGTEAQRSLMVMDATGREVLTTTLMGTSATLDLTSLSTGMYVLRVAEGSNTQHMRVVKR
jgi:hypothetical protein